MAPLPDTRQKTLAARRRLAAFCVLAGLLPLGIAFRAELHGVLPCALCLWERWPYRVLIALGVIGTMLPRSFGHTVGMLALLAMLGGAGLGLFHLGVEQHWWPSAFAGCAALVLPPDASPAQIIAALPAHASRPCDVPAVLLPGLPSMAALNLAYALILVGTIGIMLPRTRRARTAPPRRNNNPMVLSA